MTFNFETFTTEEQAKLVLLGADQESVIIYRSILKAFPESTLTPFPDSHNVHFNVSYQVEQRNVRLEFFMHLYYDKTPLTFPTRNSSNQVLDSIKTALTTLIVGDGQHSTTNFRGYEVFEVDKCREYLDGGQMPEYLLTNIKMFVNKTIGDVKVFERQRQEIDQVSDEFYPSRKVGREVYIDIMEQDDVIHEEAIKLLRSIGMSLKHYFK